MSDAAPPPWVRQLSLPSGAWRCLVGLWGFASFTAEGPAQVWPSRETLAEVTGQKPATVAKQLRKLRDLGWIVRAPSGVLWLAWRIPWSSDRIPQSSDTTVVGPDTLVTTTTTTGTPDRRPQGPLTCTDLPTTSNDLGGDAPATPDPQPTRETRPHDDPTPANPHPCPARSLARSDDASPDGRVDSPGPTGLRQPATEANRHLDTTAQRHAARLAEAAGDAALRCPADARRLSPELWAVIESCGWEQQARAATWCERANESLERVLETERPATLRRLLEAWDVSTHQGGVLRPKKRELWDWCGRKWREAVLDSGKPKGTMNGGIVASRPLPDWDGEAERRAAQ